MSRCSLVQARLGESAAALSPANFVSSASAASPSPRRTPYGHAALSCPTSEDSPDRRRTLGARSSAASRFLAPVGSFSDAALSPPLFFFLVRRVPLERPHQQQRRRALATIAQSACTATAPTRRGEAPLARQAVGLVPAAVRRQRRLRLLVRRLDSPAKTTAPRSRGRAPLARPADDQEQPRLVRRHRRRHPPRPPRRLCALQVLLLERQLADDGQRQRRRDERKGRHGHADVVGRCRDDDRVDRGGAGDGREQQRRRIVERQLVERRGKQRVGRERDQAARPCKKVRLVPFPHLPPIECLSLSCTIDSSSASTCSNIGIGFLPDCVALLRPCARTPP